MGCPPPLRREVIFSMIIIYFIVVIYNIIFMSDPKSIDADWPLNTVGVKSGQNATIELNGETKEFFITPGGDFPDQRTSFTITYNGDDPVGATSFLNNIIEQNVPVTLTVDGNSQNIIITPDNYQPNSDPSILGGQYYLTKISPGGPARRGGRSIRSHYRKRKSSRHVSNKKYSMGRRGRSRRVRRSRKN